MFQVNQIVLWVRMKPYPMEVNEILTRVMMILILTLHFSLITTTDVLEAASPSNAGFTGLYECPTAQMPGDGKGWIGHSWSDPYRTWYVTLGYLPWMEFNLRYIGSSDGFYKYGISKSHSERGVDLKLLLYSGNGWTPSLAVGGTDLLEDGIQEALYAVATWEWEKLALSAGYGSDRYNGFFGGLSWMLNDSLELKAEYCDLDPSQKERELFGFDPHETDENWNFGIHARTDVGLDLGISRQRDEEWSLSVSWNLDFSKPVFGGRKKRCSRPPDEDILLPDWNRTDLNKLSARLVEELGQNLGIRDVEVLIGEKKILLAYENIGYSSQAEAMARVIYHASFILPWDVKVMTLVVKVRGDPVARVDVPGSHVALLRMGEILVNDNRETEVTWFRNGLVEDGEKWFFCSGPGDTEAKGVSEFRAMISYEPRIDAVDDDSYMDRWSVDWIYRMRTSSGWEVFLDVRQPLLNDADIPWEPEVNDYTRIYKGVASFAHPGNDSAFLMEAGWLDDQWFGGNAWGRFYGKDGRWWAGARVSLFHERDPESFCSLSDDPVEITGGGRVETDPGSYRSDEWEWAWWLQAGYSDPLYNLDLMAEWGRFIDGDEGIKLTATRWWNDLGIGFWIAKTDELTRGRDYSNLGMYLNIPPGALWGSSLSYSQEREFSLLSKWNYYAARQPGAWKTPEQLWGQLQPARLRDDLYYSLVSICCEISGKELPETGVVYSLYDYLSGNYRMFGY